jgi:hypothetical protein
MDDFPRKESSGKERERARERERAIEKERVTFFRVVHTRICFPLTLAKKNCLLHEVHHLYAH